MEPSMTSSFVCSHRSSQGTASVLSVSGFLVGLCCALGCPVAVESSVQIVLWCNFMDSAEHCSNSAVFVWPCVWD